eukprot:gene225-299_t
MANIVAIVGRPNVGKSTLFNRLVEDRKAIMSSESGTTRDRHYGYATWNGKNFTVIDTGGYVQDSADVFEESICQQVKIAIDEASVVLLLVDCQVGITSMDQAVAQILRGASKPVILVANKADNVNTSFAANEFYALGLGTPCPISAASGTGTGELLDEVVAHCQQEAEEENELPKIAIIGRPNVGKSSLLNALLGEERSIVTPIAGTTRDAIDTTYNLYGKKFILTDTAGIRKKSKVKEDIEFYATLRSIKALQDADVCIVMIDATAGLEAQDASLLSLAYRYKKGMVLLVNKWDLVEKDHTTHMQYTKQLQKQLGDLSHVPILFISALQKQRIFQAVEKALEVYENKTQKIATATLNQIMLPLIERYPPPAVKGKYIRIKYIARLPTYTPVIAFFCNLPQYISATYKKYLENQLRKNFPLDGVPIQRKRLGGFGRGNLIANHEGHAYGGYKTVKSYKTTYNCQACGAQYAKHQGKCYACSAWNTIVEEVASPSIAAGNHVLMPDGYKQAAMPKQLHEITYETQNRITCPDRELNRVLGGGIVAGSLVLVGGEPGIGKSTLLLQLALSLSSSKVLYVSGEESESQVKMRANRIKHSTTNCYILNEVVLESILGHLAQLQPDIIIIDSIQTIYAHSVESSAGSVAQVRMATDQLMRYAKTTNTPIFLIGHITKEGTIAGPKVLEHMVDTVLQFEGDRHLAYRIVRSIKNRFGAASELGIYEMHGDGLKEVTNPSALLLSQRESQLSGIATSSFIEGNRSLLVEVQALVSTATYGTPQRATTGFDSKRLNMLLAVLEKRVKLRLATQDVFLNIAGGIKVEDPALDLAVCVSIISSLKDIIVPTSYCFAAEVGLGGEVRAVQKIEQRIVEASRLGFTHIFIAGHNYKGINLKSYAIDIRPVEHVSELYNALQKKNYFSS